MVGVEPRYLPPTPRRLSPSVCFCSNKCGVCRCSSINVSSLYVYMYDVCTGKQARQQRWTIHASNPHPTSPLSVCVSLL